MKDYGFDKVIAREGTNAVKFDGRKAYFGTEAVTPLWVADMDFAAPDCIIQALQKRADHPVFGYSLYPESVYQSIIDWFSYKHRWSIAREWIVMAPGVVPSIFAAVKAFANEGEGVIVQPPVYFPFFSAVTINHRELVLNPLLENNGRYEIDVAHLELCAQQGARLLLLCTPHNPVGRVWSPDELQAVLRIARQYDLTILSDDIHCDLTFSGVTHTMLGRLAQAGDKIITAIAPNKTFNIPGLGLSALIIPDEAQRNSIKQVFDRSHAGNTNPFSIVAFEAAYRGGHDWLEALMAYLEVTRDMAVDYVQQHLPRIKCHKPEATCLLWLDCRQLNMKDAELRDFFIHRCGLGLSPGVVFGDGGSGFMRMNIGTSRQSVVQALEKIRAQL